MTALLPVVGNLRPLGFDDHELREIDVTCRAIEPSHKVRAGMLSSMPKSLERVRPEACPRFDALVARFPKRHYFSMVPLSEAYIQILAHAKLMHPELSYREAQRRTTREGIDEMVDNPMLRIMAKALREDFGEYLRFLVESMASMQNYGERSLETLGPRHVRIHYEGDYPIIWFEAGLAFTEAVFDVYGVADGEVRGELLDPDDPLHSPWFYDMRW